MQPVSSGRNRRRSGKFEVRGFEVRGFEVRGLEVPGFEVGGFEVGGLDVRSGRREEKFQV